MFAKRKYAKLSLIILLLTICISNIALAASSKPEDAENSFPPTFFVERDDGEFLSLPLESNSISVDNAKDAVIKGTYTKKTSNKIAQIDRVNDWNREMSRQIEKQTDYSSMQVVRYYFSYNIDDYYYNVGSDWQYNSEDNPPDFRIDVTAPQMFKYNVKSAYVYDNANIFGREVATTTEDIYEKKEGIFKINPNTGIDLTGNSKKEIKELTNQKLHFTLQPTYNKSLGKWEMESTLLVVYDKEIIKLPKTDAQNKNIAKAIVSYVPAIVFALIGFGGAIGTVHIYKRKKETIVNENDPNDTFDIEYIEDEEGNKTYTASFNEEEVAKREEEEHFRQSHPLSTALLDPDDSNDWEDIDTGYSNHLIDDEKVWIKERNSRNLRCHNYGLYSLFTNTVIDEDELGDWGANWGDKDWRSYGNGYNEDEDEDL